MSNDDVARMDDRMLAAWGAHDVDGVLAVLADDFVWTDLAVPQRMRNIDEARQYVQDASCQPGSRIGQLDCYFLPRLRRLDASLLAMIGGSWRVGKENIIKVHIGWLVLRAVHAMSVVSEGLTQYRGQRLSSALSSIPHVRRGAST
jgi:hypothetical protein